MEYYIEGLAEITSGVDSGGNKYMRCSQSIRPRTGSSGWYYPVYAWYIAKPYRTEFTATVSVSTGFREASNVDFYLCGPVDEDYFTIDVDHDTGVPNLPILVQASIYNPGDLDGDEYDETVTASLNIGSSYGGTELAANEVYVLFIVRKGASTSDGAVTASFRTNTYTDDGPPPYDGEWHILHAPWYADTDTSGYSINNLFLPEYNLLCIRIDHESKEGSWTVDLNAGTRAIVYLGTTYRWNSKTGVPSAQTISNPGTSVRLSDIPATMQYVWIRFVDGSSGGNVSVDISFTETQVQTDWHAHVPVISMNSGSVLPNNGTETWSSGLGEKEVLVYRFKLNENYAPTFSYNGTQSMWMCISTVPYVNSRTGAPEPSSSIRGQGNGTSFSVTASTVLTAQTWYYLFIEVSSGDPYSGQITITYQAGYTPEPPEPEWTYSESSAQTDILIQTTRDVTLTSYAGTMFRVSFRFSGAASFSVSGSVNAYIYATAGDYDYSRSSGVPYDINGNELPSGTSTSIYVGGTGYTYYIWIKGQTSDTAGTVTVTITPPPVVWTETTDGAGAKSVIVRDEAFVEAYELTVEQTMVYRYDITFSRSGTVRIYSVGSTESSDVMAYFSSVPRTFNRTLGRPDNYDELWSDAGPGDYNFSSGALEVSAGTTYYLWVRGMAADTTAHIWVDVSGGGTSGDDKIWIYAGNQWVQAIPYLYTSNQWVRATAYDYTGNRWEKCP